MQNWFECRVKYTKIDEKTGKEKRVTEPYLVDAISFTEAEERIVKEMESVVSGDFAVKNIRPVNFTDIIVQNDGDKFYKTKVTFMSIDEAAGKEKKVANYMLVSAYTVEEATENIKKALEGMTVDYNIASVSETKIVDVFFHS